jgi:hypothetical protein
MDFGARLFGLLAQAAGLAVDDALPDGPARAAFDALRERLSEAYRAAVPTPLDPEAATALRQALDRPEVAADGEMRALADALFRALPLSPRGLAPPGKPPAAWGSPKPRRLFPAPPTRRSSRPCASAPRPA